MYKILINNLKIIVNQQMLVYVTYQSKTKSYSRAAMPYNETQTNSSDTIKTPKFINFSLNSLNINPDIASQTINLKNCTAKGNISFTHNDAESSKNLFICDMNHSRSRQF